MNGMVVRGRTCASCKSFDLAASLESGGVAACAMFGRQQEHGDRACVLHDEAADVVQRKALVLQLTTAKEPPCHP